MTTDEYAPLADLYDLWSADMADDIPFYVAEAVASGGPVLEVGAGTGRVTAPIARAGIPIVGTDVSPSMLDRARKRVAADGLGDRVELVEADMRRFDLGRTFPLVILPFRVLAHALTTEDQVATLRAIRSHLAPGGRLVFNLPVPSVEDLATSDGLRREGRYRLDDDASSSIPGTDAVLWRHAEYEPGSQLLRMAFVVDHLDPDGTVARRVYGESTARQCTPGELEHALVRTGFRLVDRWGWFDRRPFDAHAPEMVWAAVRDDTWRRT